MASYRISVWSKLVGTHLVSELGGSTVSWTHATAMAWVKARKGMAGDEITVERQKDGTVGRSGCFHPWLTHRRFVADANGVAQPAPEAR